MYLINYAYITDAGLTIHHQRIIATIIAVPSTICHFPLETLTWDRTITNTMHCPSNVQVLLIFRAKLAIKNEYIYYKYALNLAICFFISSEGRCSFLNSTAAKILHLIIFGIVLPCLCICIPVYAKYVLYADSVITLGASDMRLVDGHVSTTWCKVCDQTWSFVLFLPFCQSTNFYILVFNRAKIFK